MLSLGDIRLPKDLFFDFFIREIKKSFMSVNRLKMRFVQRDGAKSKKGDSMKKLIKSGIISLVAASALMGAGSMGDIVIIVDESGSMSEEIAQVKKHAAALVKELEDRGIDYQLGLVGFGQTGSTGSLNPEVIVPLTDNNETFIDGINTLTATGYGWEPGFAATSRAMSSDMETATFSFREGAGTCIILMTDEDSDYDIYNPGVEKAEAIAAMLKYNTKFYGIIDTSNPYYAPNSTADYGPDANSLAAVTGGTVWDIGLLNDTTGGEILDEVLKACISEAIKPEIDFDVHPQSCPNPINMKSGGLTPMAILGSDSLDVNDIDVDSLSITIDGSIVYPVKHAYEDVAEPYAGEQSEEANKYECWEFVATEEVPEYAGDGYMDLTLKFKTKDLIAAGLDEGVQYLEINATKLDEDGTPISGKDVIWVK